MSAYLCETWKIDERKSEDIRRVDSEIDGLGGDACILSGLELGIPDNLFSNLLEIVNLLAREMEELSPLVWVCLVAICSWCWRVSVLYATF